MAAWRAVPAVVCIWKFKGLRHSEWYWIFGAGQCIQSLSNNWLFLQLIDKVVIYGSGGKSISPGAGNQPPELAGRDEILADARGCASANPKGRIQPKLHLRRLRGVGKTVLLNRTRELAEEAGFLTISIEAREDTSLPALLIPPIRKALLSLSRAAMAGAAVGRALRVLKSFASNFKTKFSLGEEFDVELGIAEERGAADSGDLEHDLGELMMALAEAAKDKGASVCFLIDELQYLYEKEMSALIMALHQVSQRSLPMVMFAAGLPLILGLAGRSKSYSERLFIFPSIGVLDKVAARQALERPLAALGVSLAPDAVEAILHTTGRYPYFLQQWGYEAWSMAASSPISLKTVHAASTRAIRQLDESFFRVRFDRLTKREKDFLFAMVNIGGETQRSGDIADKLGVRTTSIGPLRSSLIRKGMIYSPAHGDNAFTVPLFDDFLRRQLGA